MLVIQVAENEEYLYSLDGTDPEEFGFAYDGPVLLDTTGDIKLRIKKLGNSKEEKIVEFSVKTEKFAVFSRNEVKKHHVMSVFMNFIVSVKMPKNITI